MQAWGKDENFQRMMSEVKEGELVLSEVPDNEHAAVLPRRVEPRALMPTERTYQLARSWFPHASQWAVNIAAGLIAPFSPYEKWLMAIAGNARIRAEEHEGDRAVMAYWVTRVASLGGLWAPQLLHAHGLSGIVIALVGVVLANIAVQLIINIGYLIVTGVPVLWQELQAYRAHRQEIAREGRAMEAQMRQPGFFSLGTAARILNSKYLGPSLALLAVIALNLFPESRDAAAHSHALAAAALINGAA